jgi:hypothetical protein
MAGISAMTMTALEGVNHRVLVFGGSAYPQVFSKCSKNLHVYASMHT